MKNKLWFAVLLLSICSQGMADWVKISANEKSVVYMDPSQSKKVGSNVMIWLLRDHASAQFEGTAPSLSSKDQIEVECSGRRIRRIYSAAYAQHMGEGAPFTPSTVP
jgi:hypothetical protein